MKSKDRVMTTGMVLVVLSVLGMAFGFQAAYAAAMLRFQHREAWFAPRGNRTVSFVTPMLSALPCLSRPDRIDGKLHSK
jgi:hypothetical protein